MLSVYLDANVYNDVERKDIPAEEVEAFVAARERGDVVVHLSFPDLEESLGLWEKDRPAALRRLRLARDLAGFEGLLNQPSDLLWGAIQAYAVGVPPPSPTLPRPQRRYHASLLDKMLQGSSKADRLVSKILANVRVQKETDAAGMADARAEALGELSLRYGHGEWRTVPFAEFFAKGAEEWAADFAGYKGLAGDCRRRGLAGLLTVRTVRLFVGAAMSIAHSMVCAGRKPDFGDKYDLWHVILASTADVFVTRDTRLFDHLARVPGVDGFRVVKSFGEVL